MIAPRNWQKCPGPRSHGKTDMGSEWSRRCPPASARNWCGPGFGLVTKEPVGPPRTDRLPPEGVPPHRERSMWKKRKRKSWKKMEWWRASASSGWAH